MGSYSLRGGPYRPMLTSDVGCQQRWGNLLKSKVGATDKITTNSQQRVLFKRTRLSGIYQQASWAPVRKPHHARVKVGTAMSLAEERPKNLVFQSVGITLQTFHRKY